MSLQLKCINKFPPKLSIPLIFAFVGIILLGCYWDRYRNCKTPINIWILINLLFILFRVIRHTGAMMVKCQFQTHRKYYRIFGIISRIVFSVWNIIGLIWFYLSPYCLQSPDYWIIFSWFMIWGIGFCADLIYFAKNTLCQTCNRFLPNRLSLFFGKRRKGGHRFNALSMEDSDDNYDDELDFDDDDDNNDDDDEIFLYRLPPSPLFPQDPTRERKYTPSNSEPHQQ